MTYEDQKQYYSNLLAIQYRGGGKNQAMMQALAGEALIDNLTLAVRDAFNIDPTLGPLAIGVQLDTVGKYIGVSRNVLTFSGGFTLNDSDYLTLLYFKIILNSCKGSLLDIETLIFRFFGNGITVFDNADMTLSYFINSSVGTQILLEAVVELGLLPKPTGVGLASIIYAVGLNNYFAYGSYYLSWPVSGVSGFGSYYSVSNQLFTGNTFVTSPIISATSINTSLLSVGEPIAGAGIPPSSYIYAIDSSSQIRIGNIQSQSPVNSLVSASAANLVSAPSAPWINYGNVIDL